MSLIQTPGEIRTSVREGIGTLLISNPAKRNAMSKAMWAAFSSSMAALDADPEVRVIVVRGDGDLAFVSGADISQFEGQRNSEQEQADYDATAAEAYAAPGRASKPVIAAIRGNCIGGGLGLAAACDLRICSTDARFRMPAARLGLAYHVDGVDHFVGLVGPQQVLDLFMTARVFSAEEALRIGFVAAVESTEGIDLKVAEVAAMIAQNAPLTLRAVKLSVQAACNRKKSTAKAAHEAVAACSRSSDYVEGRKAFIEKRAPRFTGR